MGLRGLLIVLLMVALQTVVSADSQSPQGEGYGLIISTTKAVYSPGETISVTLSLFNYTHSNIVFRYNSSQRYDFVALKKGKQEVWRWSEGRVFLQVLGEVELGPGRPEITFTEEIPGGLGAGAYVVSGIITSMDKSLSASIPVEVR